MADAIVLKGIHKTFGELTAVDDLDLVVPQGGLYGFIGPNGAGKTTTIRMIMSILFSDRGELSVLGRESALEAKDRIGYLPEERGVYKKMRTAAYLRYIAELKGVPSGRTRKKVGEWLERVRLAGIENKKCEELSKGMQQKIQFLAAVIHDPELLILDEPFSGLDPVNQRLLRDLVMEQHARGATVIFSTHVMHQAEQICDHIIMINHGKKVLDDSMSGIRSRFDPRTVILEPLDTTLDEAHLSGVVGVSKVDRTNGAYEISLEEGTDPTATIRELVNNVPIARVELHRPTLEDIFIQIVTGDTIPGSEDMARLRASLRDGGSMEVAP